MHAAQELARSIAGVPPRNSIELSEISKDLFDYSSSVVREVKALVAQSDVLIVATPTYKASFTGLLKAFLDNYAAGELAGTFAIPFMTIGSDKHFLAAETQLRPVLVELGASVPTAAFSLNTEAPSGLDDAITAWVDQNRLGIKAFELCSAAPGGGI
ncbi:NADPH-dependent FMN reductase [Mycolicibacterium confluentis]